MSNTYVSGPQGSAVPLTREQQLEIDVTIWTHVRADVDQLVTEAKLAEAQGDDVDWRELCEVIAEIIDGHEYRRT